MPNGSNQTRLTFTSAPFKDEQPAWSPDGARIAFVSTRLIRDVQLAADGTGTMTLNPIPQRPGEVSELHTRIDHLQANSMAEMHSSYGSIFSRAIL